MSEPVGRGGTQQNHTNINTHKNNNRTPALLAPPDSSSPARRRRPHEEEEGEEELLEGGRGYCGVTGLGDAGVLGVLEGLGAFAPLQQQVRGGEGRGGGLID